MGSVEVRNRGRKEEAMEEEEMEENYTHMCKICKKKFVSGRAFGGHMRIHGPVAMAAAAESNERKRSRLEARTRDVQEEEGGEFDAGYELRRHPRPSWRFSDRDYSFLAVGGGGGGGHGFETRPTRPKSCQTCGKEFDSWKMLLRHMKCHEENLDQYPEAESTEQEEEEGGTGSESESESEQHGQPMENSGGWMKGKRSKRARHLQGESNNKENCNSNSVSEEEDMAICLVMLASGVDTKKPKKEGGQEESANSGSQRPRPRKVESSSIAFDDEAKKVKYVCTTCNKSFHSYQALGGHRASHKKIKGCSSRFDENDIEIDNEREIESLEEEDVTDEEQEKLPQEAAAAVVATTTDERAPATLPVPTISVISAAPLPPGKKNFSSSKIHECSICHRVFSTGQALGGHKRCHWGTGGNSETTSTVSSTKESPPKSRRPELLDLNLPASADEEDDCIQETSNNKLALGVDYSSQKAAIAASDVESHSKISVPMFQSWWTEHPHPKQQGLFLYQRTHLPHEDEVDSKLGSKIGFGRAQEKYIPNRPQPWLQL